MRVLCLGFWPMRWQSLALVLAFSPGPWPLALLFGPGRWLWSLPCMRLLAKMHFQKLGLAVVVLGDPIQETASRRENIRETQS